MNEFVTVSESKTATAHEIFNSNKGLVINGDEFSFGTEEQFITFIKNKNHININLE